MIPAVDGRENIEDWFFLENLKRKDANNLESPDGARQQLSDDDNTPKKRTKDFIENELRAMSTLSLYDDSVDKMKSPETDKWVTN